MSTTSEKLRGLVEAIYAQTVGERIDWSISDDKSRVSADINTYKIEIFAEASENSFQADIRYSIYNSNGDLVDTLTDQTISSFNPVNVNLNSYFSVMSNTLEMAKRQASGADKAIESILLSLGAHAVKDKPSPRFFGSSDDLDDDVAF